jgi:serine/threonine protein kinase
VWMGYHAKSKALVAIKEINLDALAKKGDKLSAIKQRIQNEISIMNKISHPNVLRLYNYKVTNKEAFLVLEYCSEGDLEAFMNKIPGSRLNEKDCQLFLHQIGILSQNNYSFIKY